MKTCSYCGGTYPDDTSICPIDHTPIGVKATTSAPGIVSAAHPHPIEFEYRSLSPEQMQDAWVTLVRCGTLVAADLVVMRLRGAGIDAFIPDEYLMQADGFNFNTFGYVRVQIAPKDYDDAKALLAG